MRRSAFGALLLAAVAVADVPSVDLESFLPVHSERLQVGAVQAQRRPTGVSQPFFLIGTDDVSLAWLIAHHAQLRALHAFGLVVEAPDASAYRRIAAVAEGLVIRPVNADLLAEHLALAHYPALVTADGIFP